MPMHRLRFGSLASLDGLIRSLFSAVKRRPSILFFVQLNENLQYQRVIKDQAVAYEAEAALSHISVAPDSSE